MDHILANQDNPVPDSVSDSGPALVMPAAGGGENVNEDEDMKAAIALSQDAAEAKVRRRGREGCLTWEVVLIDWLVRTVD